MFEKWTILKVYEQSPAISAFAIFVEITNHTAKNSCSKSLKETQKRSKVCLKLTIKTPERRHLYR